MRRKCTRSTWESPKQECDVCCLLFFQALAEAMSADGRLPEGKEAEEPVQLALVGRPNVGKGKRWLLEAVARVKRGNRPVGLLCR